MLKRLRRWISNSNNGRIMIKVKLCFVIPSLQTGGMERVMSELAKYFCGFNNFEVHLIMYGKSPIVFYEVPDELIIHYPKIAFNKGLRALSTIKRIFYLRHEVDGIEPDKILSFGEYWNSFVLLALIGLNYPVYISDRCSPLKKYSTKHFLLRKLLYKRAKGIIVQTEKARQIYIKEFNKVDICVIGNPIRKISSNCNELHKDKIVLTIGRLINSKHHNRLVQLFAHIPFTDWKLIIVGDDALKQRNSGILVRLITELQLEDRVLLVGQQSDVDSYLLRSKIFVFTSSSEGFPNVIGEALTAGLPVVSYDCVAGPSEMINDGENGFLIPVFNDELFRNKLQILMENDTLRKDMSRNAIISMEKFSTEHIGQMYYSFIIGKE
jgi:GalNAc-alpha-(1->4)-GalNAc-alpha-(1->3)-diNAcBac-PP-undecaprenol alpha-1,4-N-acetyl-D-galactosaminyltransferase